ERGHRSGPHGERPRQAGESAAGQPVQGDGDRRAREHAEEARTPEPAEEREGWNPGARGADPALEASGGLPELQPADANWFAPHRRGREAVLQKVRNGDVN